MDLVCELQVDRRLNDEYRRTYDSESKKQMHEKILLLRAQGTLEDADGNTGAWTAYRQGVET
jgi:hypothetical protein